MDSLSHVNNAVYARWLEQARIAYFLEVGLIGGGTVGPILARQSIDFVLPVTYPDHVTVSVKGTKVGTTSVVLAYEARSHAQNGATVMRAESVIVVYDYAAGKKAPVSDELRARIQGGTPG
jgi:acyl-CoA thioester hydrolase